MHHSPGSRAGVPHFSLTCGGPCYRLLSATRLWRPTLAGALKAGVLLALLTWLPLLLGVDASTRAAFLYDVGVHVRLLFVVPLLMAAEVAIDRRLKVAVAELELEELVDADNRESAAAAVRSAHRLRDSGWGEGMLALAVVVLCSAEILWVSPRDPWMYDGPQRSFSGLWYSGVAIALYRFLLLRWLWRLVIWTALLTWLTRAPLKLQAAHPDAVGGLSVLVEAQQSFGWLAFAMGSALAGALTSQVRYSGASVLHYNWHVAVFVASTPLVLLAPVFVFCWPLERLRRRTRARYVAMLADFSRRYETAWLTPASARMPLGSPDPSSHADLITSFDRSVAVRMFPFTRFDFIFLLGCAGVPLLPFLMQGIPPEQMLAHLRALLG